MKKEIRLNLPLRSKIIFLLKNKTEPMTISQIRKELKNAKGEMYNYKSVNETVHKLKDEGVVFLHKPKKKKFHPVEVKFNHKIVLKYDKGTSLLLGSAELLNLLNPKNWKKDGDILNILNK